MLLKEEMLARMVFLLVKIKKALSILSVIPYLSNWSLVVDQFIANNTAEGSVKVVAPHLLDLDIVDVTPQMLDARTLLKDSFLIPYYKQLNITEWDNNWILIRDHYYLVKLFLFDRDKNPIQLTENLVFKNIFDPEYFDIIKINKISSEVIVRAK